MDLNVSLPEELAEFVRSQVAAGGYRSSSDVVAEAVRRMQQIERRDAREVAVLRKAWQEGLDSGEAQELDFEALKAEGRARLAHSKA